jgi:Glutamine amidotransferase domain
MCGIAGFFAKPGSDQSLLKTIAAVLAIEIESRGGQSWGTVDHENRINKGVGPITLNLNLPAVMSQTYVMHTRFATHGGVTRDNAHPFAQGDVIGVHNGVISNHEFLNFSHQRNFAVDSQHIFQHIADGTEHLNDIQGYGAIVYTRGGKWFGGTFNRGELAIAHTPLGKVFASTNYAVGLACSLAGVDIESWDEIRDNRIYELTPETLTISYEVAAGLTRSKWDDSIKKKGGGEILALPANIVEVEEHETRRDDYECAHCYMDALPERHYINDEGQVVCPECAKNSYCFIAEDDYSILDVETLCELCAQSSNPAVRLKEEDMSVCMDCFEIQFNTKGLRKVVTLAVN